MTLLRVIHAELLKLKRTMALKMVVLAPGIVVMLLLFVASQAPFSTVRRNAVGGEWMGLAYTHLLFWTVLMLPLFITLEAALLAGLDHAENQWKSLYARPVPRWTFYIAKLLIAMSMMAVSALLLLGGILVVGKLLPLMQDQLKFASPIPLGPMFRQIAAVTALNFLALSIQHWVSLRWRAFSVAIGTGMAAVVVSYVVIVTSRQGGWQQYFPWSLPMLVLVNRPVNLEAVLWISGVLGLLVTLAGCWDFCRREVQ